MRDVMNICFLIVKFDKIFLCKKSLFLINFQHNTHLQHLNVKISKWEDGWTPVNHNEKNKNKNYFKNLVKQITECTNYLTLVHASIP